MDRSNIPESIKRAVRQRCHFGCIICGIPIFDYDHIEAYSTTLSHEENNIVLLCPFHHAEKTRGRISVNTVRKRSLKPFNRGQSFTSKTKIGIIEPDTFSVKIAGVIYTFDAMDGQVYPVLNIECLSYVSFTREHLELLPSIYVPDENGKIILQIDKGELALSTGVWDYNIVGKILRVSSKEHDVIISIRYEEEYIEIQKIRVKDAFGLKVESGGERIVLSAPDGSHLNVSFEDTETKNCCFLGTRRGAYWVSVNDFGHIHSEEYDNAFVDLLSVCKSIKDNDVKKEALAALSNRSRRSAPHADASEKLLEARMDLSETILPLVSDDDHLWKARARFNAATAKMHLALRNRSAGLALESLDLFCLCLGSMPEGYEETEKAQLLANVCRASAVCIKNEGVLDKTRIEFAVSCGRSALDMYERQYPRLTQVEWPNTLNTIADAKSFLEENL